MADLGDGDARRKLGSSNLINKLITEFEGRRYLEIGVHSGDTFVNVRAAEREAVDPHFRFDWEAEQNESSRLFQETSDAYFARFPAEKRERFDIIFLDGLHTFEQTYRDFLNTLDTSHPRTVWVIDDTVPSDPFSIWQNQRQAVEIRRLSGTSRTKPGAWQGDVFKLVFAIHDFMPGFCFATVGEGNKLQTVAWRERRRDFKPLFNSLETISRMSFMEYMLHRDAMNFGSADALPARIREGWARDGIA